MLLLLLPLLLVLLAPEVRRLVAGDVEADKLNRDVCDGMREPVGVGGAEVVLLTTIANPLSVVVVLLSVVTSFLLVEPLLLQLLLLRLRRTTTLTVCLGSSCLHACSLLVAVVLVKICPTATAAAETASSRRDNQCAVAGDGLPQLIAASNNVPQRQCLRFKDAQRAGSASLWA